MNSSKVIKQSFFHPSINKVFCTGKKHLAMMTETPSYILSQYLWYNANIYIDQTSIHFSRFPKKNINYVPQLFNNNGSIK